jgi:hypothetical protein
MLMGAHKTQRMGLGFDFDFFRAIQQRWQWISQSHHMSNRWWNLGFISECWNQRAVKAVDAHTLTKQAKKVQTNVCQKANGNCFLGQERSAYGGIHATSPSIAAVTTLRSSLSMHVFFVYTRSDKVRKLAFMCLPW